MTPQHLNKKLFLMLLIFSLAVTGIGCTSNADNVNTVTTTTTITTASTVIQTSVQTITVPPSPLPTITVTETLSPITTSTTPTNVPTTTTTTGWTIIPTTTTTTSPPTTITVPDNKSFLMADIINIPVYDASAFQQDINTVQFFPYNNNGVYISLSFNLHPTNYLYLEIQSNAPLDCSNLNIPYNLSDGQGLTILINKILNGNYTSLTNNFHPSWVHAYEQTKSGDIWETNIILYSVDIGTYALYLINTSGKTSSVSYYVYGWN